MKFFVSADETGNIKEVTCLTGTDTSKKDGQQPESVLNILQPNERANVRNRITHLKLFQDKWLLACRLGNFFDIYENFGESPTPEENYKLLHSYKFDVDANDKPVALVLLESHDCAFVVFESCKLYVVNLSEETAFQTAPLMLALPSRQDEKPATVCAFVPNPYEDGVFAYGGKENDLQIARIYSGEIKKASFTDAQQWNIEILFQAKNVKPDHLDIESPIWITNILFQKSEKHYRLVTSTRDGHIRLYHTKKARPQSYKISEKPILTLAFASDSQDEIIISDTHTFVARFSLTQIDERAQRIVLASAGTFYKPSLKLMGRYSEGGNTGAIIGTAMGEGRIAFGGLDRYLRVFEIASRKLVAKVYLGVQISAIVGLEFNDGKEEDPEKREAQENDEFWSELGSEPTIQKKKRKI